jgi:hypothetical protein
MKPKDRVFSVQHPNLRGTVTAVAPGFVRVRWDDAVSGGWYRLDEVKEGK